MLPQVQNHLHQCFRSPKTILGIEAEVTKVEDIEEMMRYNILTTPVLIIDEEIKIKGRVAQANEIVKLLEK